MTKQQLQKELKEKVKPGVKPSQLKRSKSLSDIPKAPPLPKTLTKSKSAQELEPNNSKIEQLESKISALELKLEVSSRELSETQTEKALFAEQLKEKQAQVEKIRERLEATNKELNSLKAEQSSLLDENLTLKHQNLKEWFKHYQQTQKVEKELAENVEYASEELVSQDRIISSLRTENSKLKQTSQSLEKDLKLSQRLAELRREPWSNKDAWPQLPFNWITLILTIFALWIWIKQPHYD